MITEKLLQFIWKFQYLNTKELKTLQGDTVTILNKGEHNTNQGPDFLNAKIKIEQTTLAGNIEMHLFSKDWFVHQHQKDAHYKNIILHLVWEHNIEEDKIQDYPIIELKHYISKIMLEKYEALMHQFQFIPCEKQIAKITSLQLNNWKERLLIERLEQKTKSIFDAVENNKNDWEETFWQKLARNFGIKVNADAFESIALNTPHIILAKNKLSQVKLESILLGQAGMLHGKFVDDYVIMLQKEYQFLRTKYNLKPATILPQYLRMRPFGFPTIRLSQLAALIYNSSKMFSKVIACNTYKEVMQMLNVQANDYWNYHYKIDDEISTYKEKNLGEDMMHNILINTIVPIVFVYGIYKNEEMYKEKALLWLEQIPNEDNSIIKGFRNVQIKSKTAADSQALLQLKNNYCNKKLCLQCAIGVSLLKS